MKRTLLVVLLASSVAYGGTKKAAPKPVVNPDNILWGTRVVWGENILWGTGIVWLDNILWGT